MAPFLHTAKSDGIKLPTQTACTHASDAEMKNKTRRSQKKKIRGRGICTLVEKRLLFLFLFLFCGGET
jgi:hypothetical protein